MDNLQRAREEGSYGRTEDQELPLIRHGLFKVAYNHEMVFLLIAAGLAVCSLIAVIPVIQISGIMLGGTNGRGNIVAEGILLGLAVVFGTVFAIIFNGRSCEYRAEETEFVVKGPGSKTEYFYYSEVQDIDFQPYKLFFKERGCIVTITTNIRVIEYRVVFGSNKVIKDISGNPFYYLGVNSNIITTEKPQIDTELAESVFESAMVEQITMKTYREMENEGLKKGDMKWRR